MIHTHAHTNACMHTHACAAHTHGAQRTRLTPQMVKHVKSNAITVAKDAALLGMGSGQPNRVKSVEIALEKAGDAVKARARARVLVCCCMRVCVCEHT